MTSLTRTPILVKQRITDGLFQAFCTVSAVVATTILGYILWFFFCQGVEYFKPTLFLSLPDNVNPALWN